MENFLSGGKANHGEVSHEFQEYPDWGVSDCCHTWNPFACFLSSRRLGLGCATRQLPACFQFLFLHFLTSVTR